MNKEIIEVYNKVYDLFSLNHLQSMEKNTQMEFSLSENDRFYLETLALLENPTISNFATAINVSQPAGTQIVNRFITKSYLLRKYRHRTRGLHI